MEGLLEPWENCGARARQDAPDRWIDVWWSLRRCGVGGVEALTGRTTVEGGRETEMVHPSASSESRESQFISVHSAHSVPSLHSLHPRCIHITSLQLTNSHTQPCPPIIAHPTPYAVALQLATISRQSHSHLSAPSPKRYTTKPGRSSSITRPRSKLRPRQPGTTGLVFLQRVAKKGKKNTMKNVGTRKK
ncbi:hypothetical protein BGZ61DRAFT_188031 [Ilyonectria robusta]|uniref:uncharacterized protein n=1 Tax=Ilyonectria robusta TaxID=1079257 RepID=UPI001E8EE1CC|nr:uncharacterized protein BGZ61DRAFT_188031 [Ilyonectria robusta]KAH8729848.1 hypothetical protein BGZ61DRAFT_188031 [Ilyonectria robusta]